MPRPRLLTWHVHGSYLASLARVACDWYLPVRPGGPPGYGGRGASFDWGDNVHEVPADEVSSLALDGVVTQSVANWTVDRHEILSSAQRRLPTVHVEHDPPRGSPTDERHVVDDTGALVVHVTHFNRLMWDNGAVPTCVVEHGVVVPAAPLATYELARAVTAVNHIARRGRRLGADVLERLRARVPIDLVGMGAEEAGGLGEVPPRELAAFEAPYRAFVHPVRYTSLGLAVLEAMAVGLPVVGLATTELPTVVVDGVHGHIATDVDRLGDALTALLGDAGEARRLGHAAHRLVAERFPIERFVRDWSAVLAGVTGVAVGADPVAVRPVPVDAGALG